MRRAPRGCGSGASPARPRPDRENRAPPPALERRPPATPGPTSARAPIRRGAGTVSGPHRPSRSRTGSGAPRRCCARENLPPSGGPARPTRPAAATRSAPDAALRTRAPSARRRRSPRPAPAHARPYRYDRHPSPSSADRSGAPGRLRNPPAPCAQRAAAATRRTHPRRSGPRRGRAGSSRAKDRTKPGANQATQPVVPFDKRRFCGVALASPKSRCPTPRRPPPHPCRCSRRVLRDACITFLFAPNFHPAMRHAGPVRRELAVPSVMNLLGPLANPARVRRQVVGVADPDRAPLVAGALARLGAEHALVVHGRIGMDEISPRGITDVWEVRSGRVWTWELDPATYGLAIPDATALQGGDPAANAARIESLLADGASTADDAGQAALLLNAGAAGDELIRNGDGVVAAHRLDGFAGRHEPEQGQLGRAGLPLGWDHFDGPTLVVGAPDVALALEVREMLVHCGQGLKAELPRDLFEARGVALGLDVARDEVQDLALTAGERHTVSRR